MSLGSTIGTSTILRRSSPSCPEISPCVPWYDPNVSLSVLMFLSWRLLKTRRYTGGNVWACRSPSWRSLWKARVITSFQLAKILIQPMCHKKLSKMYSTDLKGQKLAASAMIVTVYSSANTVTICPCAYLSGHFLSIVIQMDGMMPVKF